MATATTLKKIGKSTASVTFIYKGKDKKGRKVEGEVNGTSPGLIKAQLLKQGIIAKSVRKKAKPLFGGGKKAIKPGDIAIFSRQLATMMKAGIPLVQSFEIVAESLDHPSLKELILDLREDVAAGGGIATALRKHPRYFDDLFCNLVDAGEQAGALETMLDRIATYKEKSESLKAKIKKALTYPIAVLAVAIIVSGILLIKVVPQFAETFGNFGAELPAFTLWVLGLSDIAIAYWIHFIVGSVVFYYTFKEAKLRSPKLAYAVDKYILKLPIIGDILYLAVMARFARTLSTTFAAGVPLIEALSSVAGAAGNRIYADSIYKVREEVESGIQLNMAIRNQKIFPPMLIQMVGIGEESGALDDMLDKVAGFYEEEVDNKVDNLSTLIEPMIMSILGVLVGGLMIAMYLPIFKIGAAI